MSIKDFLPIPEIQRVYKTKAEKYVIVRELVDVNSRKVVIVEEIVSGKQYKWNDLEWNENINSAISEAPPFKYDYDRTFKSEKDLLQDELDTIQAKRAEGAKLKGKYGRVKEFLWNFAGVDKDLLRMCPTDHAHIAAFGGTILWTGILSGFSIGYGAYMFTNSLIISLLIGIVCSCLIIFLNGFITNTLYSDGEVTISKREIISSIPRIVLGIFLGIVIAAPLQIKMFENKIDEQIFVEHRNLVIASSPYVTNEKLIANLTQEVQILKNSIEIQEKQYLNEIHSSSTGAGYGPIAKELSNRLEDSKEMLLEKSHKLITLNLKRDSLERLANHPNEADYSFISKIEALCKIASFKNNESTSLPIVNLLICIFVILICLMPIINKMMMSDGVYDILIKREGELIERITRLHIVELKKKLNN